MDMQSISVMLTCDANPKKRLRIIQDEINLRNSELVRLAKWKKYMEDKIEKGFDNTL